MSSTRSAQPVRITSQLTPIALTATATYFQAAEALSNAAGVLGLADDARNYSALAAQVRTAFLAEFYDAKKHTFATGSQTSLAMPLALGLVPDADRDAVLANLIADIRSRDNANGWDLDSLLSPAVVTQFTYDQRNHFPAHNR